MASKGREHLEYEAAGHEPHLSLAVLPSVGSPSWRLRPATCPLFHIVSSEVIEISLGFVDLILISLRNVMDVLDFLLNLGYKLKVNVGVIF